MNRYALLLFASAALVLMGVGCNRDEGLGGASGPETTVISDESHAASGAAASSLASVLDEPDLYLRAEQLAVLLRSFDVEQLPEVRRTIEALRIRESVADFGLLFRFWAALEPAEAAAWSLEAGNARFKLAAVHIAFEAWGSIDPSEALVGVLQANLFDEDVQRTAQMALYYGWFSRDRSGLEQYVHSLGSGRARQRAIFAYALALASADGTQAVTEWAESIPDEPKRFKISVFRQVMNAMVWFDMEGAVAWCDVQCDGEWGESLRLMIMRNRVRTGYGGVAVLEWISQMPREDPEQDEERKVALRTTYATWVHHDAEAAFGWMKATIASDDAPDWVRYLYPRYVLQIAPESPREGMVWAERIEDEGRREAAMIFVAQIWRGVDEDAAEVWLEQSSLSDLAREKARSPLPDRPEN
jgi:hypothetical protein